MPIEIHSDAEHARAMQRLAELTAVHGKTADGAEILRHMVELSEAIQKYETRRWPIQDFPRTSKERERCTIDEEGLIRDGVCPDCAADLDEGPHGGLSVNWYCSNRFCGSRFNVAGPLLVERITDARPNGHLDRPRG